MSTILQEADAIAGQDFKQMKDALQRVIDWLSNSNDWNWARPLLSCEDAANVVLDRLVSEGVIEQVPNPPEVRAAFRRTFRVKTYMSTILQEADAIAGQDRSRDYGHPLENHERIAAMWNVLLGPKLKSHIEPREAALMMIALKLAREVNTPKRDNLLDIAGYVKCVDMIDEKQVKDEA